MPTAKTKAPNATLKDLSARVAKLEQDNRALERKVREYARDRISLSYEITAEMEAEWERRLKAMHDDPARKISLDDLKAEARRAKAS